MLFTPWSLALGDIKKCYDEDHIRETYTAAFKWKSVMTNSDPKKEKELGIGRRCYEKTIKKFPESNSNFQYTYEKCLMKVFNLPWLCDKGELGQKAIVQGSKVAGTDLGKVIEGCDQATVQSDYERVSDPNKIMASDKEDKATAFGKECYPLHPEVVEDYQKCVQKKLEKRCNKKFYFNTILSVVGKKIGPQGNDLISIVKGCEVKDMTELYDKHLTLDKLKSSIDKNWYLTLGRECLNDESKYEDCVKKQLPNKCRIHLGVDVATDALRDKFGNEVVDMGNLAINGCQQKEIEKKYSYILDYNNELDSKSTDKAVAEGVWCHRIKNNEEDYQKCVSLGLMKLCKGQGLVSGAAHFAERFGTAGKELSNVVNGCSDENIKADYKEELIFSNAVSLTKDIKSVTLAQGCHSQVSSNPKSDKENQSMYEQCLMPKLKDFCRINKAALGTTNLVASKLGDKGAILTSLVSGCSDAEIRSKYSDIFSPSTISLSTKSDSATKLGKHCYNDSLTPDGVDPVAYESCVYKKLPLLCKSLRVGQELIKASLAEIGKKGGMIGSLASVGMDVSGCIPPRSVRVGPGQFEESEHFCKLLDADGWIPPKDKEGKLVLISYEDRTNRCLSQVKTCDQYKGKSDIFQACGMKAVGCAREWANAGTAGQVTYNETACSLEHMDLYSKDLDPNPTHQNNHYQSSLCLASAALNGVNKITSAMCEGKSDPEEKAKCYDSMKNVNDIAQAGASVATCMKLGPGPNHKNDHSPEAELARTQRKECLVSNLGNQAVDAMADHLCGNTKKYPTPEEKDACMQKLDLVKSGVNLATSVIDCNKIEILAKTMAPDSPEYKDKHSEYQACIARGSLGLAANVLTTQICRKKDGNSADNCKAAAVAIKTASNFVMCTPKKGKELSSCLVTASLNSLTEMPGVIGEVAKIASATKLVLGDVNKCKGDKVCIAAAVASQLPGDAKHYAAFAMSARAFVKLKNPCKVPSKFLDKASALVNLAGQVTTHVVYKLSNDKMKKEYAELVDDKEYKGGALYKELNSFGQNHKIVDRENEEKRKPPEGMDSQSIQLRGIEFGRKNQENILMKMQWERPFFISSTALMTASTTLKVFEQMAEVASVSNPAAAPWKVCEKAGAEGKAQLGENTKALFKSSSINLERIQRESNFNQNSLYVSFDQLNDAEAIAQYQDLERYFDGESKSLSLAEFQQLKQMEFSKKPSLGQFLAFSLKTKLQFFPEAKAFDFGSLVNLGMTQAASLFGGKSGFNGTPIGYAEEIILVFIRKGMEKVCAKQEGVCKYQSMIDLAAQKATQLLLKQHQTKVNKLMTSATGRLMIGAYVSHGVIKTMKENNEQIKTQKKIVEEALERENVFKEKMSLQKTKDNSVFELWTHYWDKYVIVPAHAKPVDPNSNLKICLGKNGELDLACSCQKSGCFKTLPTDENKGTQNIQVMAKTFGVPFKTSIDQVNSISNEVNLFMAGAKGTDEIDLVSLERKTALLNKFNNRLMAHSNEKLKKNHQKPIDIEKLSNEFGESLFASLDPELKKGIAEVSKSELNVNLEVTGKEDVPLANTVQPSNLATTVNAENSSAQTEEKIEESKKEEEKRILIAKQEKELKKVMNTTFRYDQSKTIIEDKELDLFKIISTRYLKCFSNDKRLHED